MAADVRDGYLAFRQPKLECGSCEMLVFRVYGARQKTLSPRFLSLYRICDLYDRIFECLLTLLASLAAVQVEDVRVYLL